MRRFKKQLSILLASIMLLSATTVFTGCGETTENPAEDTANTLNAESDAAETDRFANVDYDDRPFNVYTSTIDDDGGHGSSNFLIEGSSKTEGNLVNDAVLERNVTVEELLGVKLEFTQTDISFDAVAGDIRKLTQSGTQDFDLVINSIYSFSELLIEGHFRNIQDDEYAFDFEQNYWYKDYMDDLRLMDGYQYILAGDYFIDIIRSAHLLLLNKELYNDHYNRSANEVYDIVTNYEWTFDKMNEMCTGFYADLNSNNEVDAGDQFGFMTASYWGGAIPFMISGNPTYITRDDDGVPSISIQEGDRANLMASAMSEIFNNESASVAKTEVANLLLAFTQNECLMLGYQRLGALENTILRSMEGDAAVLPYPMLYAEDQRYVSSTHDTTRMGAILTTVQDMDFISTVTEVLCRETANILMPKYYKESLQVQCVDDEKAAAMIDIIHDNFGQSFILAYNAALGGNILQSFTTAIEDNREYSAVFAGYAKLTNKTLQKKFKLFEKNNVQ